MPLIPGKLPPGTCYGTPQQLLEIFSQHLSVTGTDQGVLYTTTANSKPTVVDALEPTPRIWVDRAISGSPILYSYGGTTSQNWVQLGGQTIAKTLTATQLSGSLTSRYCFYLFSLPPRSLVNWIACRTHLKFTKDANNCTLKVRINPDETLVNPFYTDTLFPNPTGTQLGISHNLYPDATNSTKPSFVFAPNVDVDYATKCFCPYATESKVWVEIGPVSADFTAGSATVWVNYSQLQG